MTEVIRRCQEEDVPRVMEVFARVYVHNPRLQERDFFEWQFCQSPWNETGEYTLWMMEDHDELRGLLGFVPLRFIHQGIEQSGCSTLTWWSEGQDGSGLRLLMKLASQFNHRFYIGLSDDSVNVYRANRVPLMDRMPRWIGVISARCLETLCGSFDSSDAKLTAVSETRLARFKAKQNVHKISRFQNDVSYMPPWNLDGHVCRAGRYLNWRYVEIPRHSYGILRCGHDGYAVYRIETISGRTESVLRLLEWSVPSTDGEAMMAALVQEAHCCGCVLMDFFCTCTAAGEALEHLGWFPETALSASIPYLFRPMNSGPGFRLAIDLPPHRQPRQLDFSRWYITKGDGDLDRVKL